MISLQVFDLKTSLPVKPYGQSGPRLLTRNTTRRAWQATFELMRNGIERVAMLGVRHREEPQSGAGPLAPGDGPAAARRDSAAQGHRV